MKDAPARAYYADLIQAVRQGAGLLDKAVPGWADHVDITGLEMAEPSRCVLGLLGGGWFESGLCMVFGVDPRSWRMPDLLDEGAGDPYAIIGLPMPAAELRAWAVDRGFDVRVEDAGREETWKVLTELWRVQVEQRHEEP